MSTAKESTSRLFTLVRTEDVSGTSGLGVVAEGVQFSNGVCAVHWISQLGVVSVYDNVYTIEQVHGHEGRTKVVFL